MENKTNKKEDSIQETNEVNETNIKDNNLILKTKSEEIEKNPKDENIKDTSKNNLKKENKDIKENIEQEEKKKSENLNTEIIQKDEKPINILQQKKDYEKLYEEQQQKIQKEIEKEPLISKKLPIFVIMQEFKTNNIFLYKILDLMQNQKKSFIRKTRKDGSCFYRGFLFQMAELLIEDKNNFSKFNIFSKMVEGEKMMLKAGFQKLVFEDFQDLLKNYFISIQNGLITKKELLASLNEKSFFDYYIMYLRFLISAYIRNHESLFEVYFPSDYHLKHFCTTQVEPIDAETDQIQIMGLFKFFEIPIRIFYIDNSNGKFANCFSLPDVNGNSREDILKSDKDYQIQFIYKPGHYDIIY